MNWTEIEKKYPNSSDACHDWFEKQWSVILEINNDGRLGYKITDGVHAVEMFIPLYGNRWLYDFFDEQGIYIGLDYHYAVGLARWFSLTIIYDKEHYEDELDTGIRKEAEYAAFLKAFEILEEKLTKE